MKFQRQYVGKSSGFVKLSNVLIGVFVGVLITGVILNQIPNNRTISEDNHEFISDPRLPISSSKPDYVVYPITPEINITHNDNISLYASSGDGLTWETAYVIENFTIYNSNTTSIYVYDTSRFLKIRNFQVFHNLSNYVIEITDCTNILFENGTLPNSYDETTMSRTSYGFYVKNSSIQVSDVEIHNIDRQFYFRDVYDSKIDQIIFFNYFYADTSIWFIDCDSIEITNCAFQDGIKQWSESAIRLWSSDNIRIINCYLWHHELFVSDCKYVIFNDNFLILEEDGIFFYNSENLIVRNNSGWIKEYFFVISNSNNSLFEENSIIQTPSYYSQYKTIYISNSHDSIIRNNDFLTNCNFLSISVCSNISIVQNLIECNGVSILELPEGDDFKQTDFEFRNNTISGRFTSLTNRIGYVPNFLQLFTLRLPINPLLLIFTVCVGVFSIIGIVFSNNKRIVTYYNEKISNSLSVSDESTLRPFWLYPNISCLFCCLFTFPTIYKVKLFDDFVSGMEFPIYPDLFNYIIMIIVWGIGLVSVISTMVRKQSEITKKLDQALENRVTEEDKLLWVKIFAVILCVGFFSYLFHYILLIFSAAVSFVYIAIMVIISALSSSNSFKVFGVKTIHIILISILLLLDFVISTALLLTRIRFFELRWLFALLPRSLYLITFLSFIDSKIDDHMMKIGQKTVMRTTEDLTEG